MNDQDIETSRYADVNGLHRQWFQDEWPTYYGAGGPGDAVCDLQAFLNRSGLPVGLVAFCGGEVCGVAALKAESIASHRHLTPWAVAGLVSPLLSGRGIRLSPKGRGVETLGTVWTLLDLTPLGRQETWEDSPAGTPQTEPYRWWRLHDEYGEQAAT